MCAVKFSKTPNIRSSGMLLNIFPEKSKIMYTISNS